ncbi:protein toll-like, partial [Dreissena polymorpha]|uniref:protein toll-like n=1 Tax=Dreissena polymorpha TaxID=45954 RepID=UPI002264AF07
RLDTLKLAGNKIDLLSNTSIASLTYLRHVDLSNNILKAIDPNTLVNQNVNILVGFFSGNEITTVDVSNWLKERPFCEYDFSNNKISQLRNTKNITLNPDKIYGTGLLILAGNLINTFPDMKTLLNLDSLNVFGSLINFGFDLRNVPLTCDCHMQPYHHLASSTLVQLWRDYFNMTCASPESLKDASIFNVDPHDFVCELTQADKCPRGCKCIDQPQNDTLYIDCESANLLEMPTELPPSPFSNKISLNLAKNDITALADVTYLNKLSLFNLSRNDLDEVGNNILGKLENAIIDIGINHRIRVLPRLIQYRNVCETVLSKLIVDCNCETLWIESWLKTRSCDNIDQSNYFKCQVPGKGTIYSTEFSESLLDCQHDLTHLISIPILCSTVLVIVGAIVTYIFRYEALVIWLKLTHSSDFASFSYDVALSFNSEDERLRKWVIKTLVPALHNEGYRTFMPFVDVERGADRTTGVIEAFKDSRNFVLILSTSYLIDGKAPENDIEEANELERKWIENEWKYAWHLFITDRRRKAIIVNYDHISASQVADKKIKAILRVGDMVNFGNHNDDMLQTIIQKIEQRVKRTGTDDFVELRVRPNANQRTAWSIGSTRERSAVSMTFSRQSTITPKVIHVTPALIKFRTNYVDTK